MQRYIKKSYGVFALVAMLCLFPHSTVFAVCPDGAQSCSGGYQVDQTFFGSGGQLESCSTQYCSKQTLGELGVGETSSLNYRAYAGFNTTDVPYIEFVVTAASIDLDYLDDTQAKTANGTFYVRAWQAGGYTVRTESDPPSNGSDQINPLATPTASSPGTEQFGMNLVANTSPTVFGAAPQQVPDGTFSFGAVSSGYGTTNAYQYNKGDAIAQSASSTSVTIYTLSYIFNIDTVTQAGKYTFNHTMVATGNY